MSNLVWIVAVISLLCIEGSALRNRVDIINEQLSTTHKDSTIKKKDELADEKLIQKRKIIEDLFHLFDIDSDIALEETKRSEEKRTASAEDLLNLGPASSKAFHGKKREAKRNKFINVVKKNAKVVQSRRETDKELYNEVLNLLEVYLNDK